MDFVFVQETLGSQLTITSGILYECEQPDCSDVQPLREAGPQRFSCDETSCYAMAYGFSTYHQLEIQFSDGKTRRSNIFETAGFESKYKVTIREADLLVQAKTNLAPLASISITILCCSVVVLLIAGIALLVWLLLKKK